jgi:hypothetical protein
VLTVIDRLGTTRALRRHLRLQSVIHILEAELDSGSSHDFMLCAVLRLVDLQWLKGSGPDAAPDVHAGHASATPVITGPTEVAFVTYTLCAVADGS